MNIQTIIEEDELPLVKFTCKNSLLTFMRYFWDEYDGSGDIEINWHMGKICTELEQVAHRVAKGLPADYDLLVNVPPGTSKTAMVSVFFPVWCWVNWYWMRFITSAHSHPLALESAEKSRDIIRSPKFREMFPEIDVLQDKDKKSNFRVVLKRWPRQGEDPEIIKGGSRISTSVTSKVIGFHAHIIIWDDLVDNSDASKIDSAALKKAVSHLDQLSTRKVDKRTTTLIGIMQRLGQADPSDHWLKKRPEKIRHICLPGEISETNGYKKYLKPAEWEQYYIDELLDPNRLGWAELDEMKSILGQYGYAGQVGQNPVPPGGGMFQIENISISDSLPWVDQYGGMVRYWDKAGTEDGGAYTVGLKMAKLTTGKFMIMDVKRGQWSSEKREQIIRNTAEADGVECTIYLEQEPGSGGKESVENSIRNLAGFNVHADRPTGEKAIRADPFSVSVNNGNVILFQAKWNDIYLDEMENFPFSTYKDQIDASSGAYNMLAKKQKAWVMRRSNGKAKVRA